jgi:hypothetical protein
MHFVCLPCQMDLRCSRALLTVLVALSLLGGLAKAADPINAPQPERPPAVDKSGYSLWNPTPRQYLREFVTDRPDLTEGPYTVDAGHFQIEMDILNYSYDRYTPARDATRFERVSIAPVNLKVGILNNLDFHLGIETYTSTRAHNTETEAVETRRGFGDIVPRLKLNFWGNDGGPTAFGVIPFAKLPTNQDGIGNSSVEGGVIFPFAMSLPLGFGLGAMTQFDAIRDTVGSGHHAEFANSVTVSRDLIGALAGYVEFYSRVSAEQDSSWIGSVDLGFTYGLTENIQLDAGINIGVTRAADDFNPFLGISFRF